MPAATHLIRELLHGRAPTTTAAESRRARELDADAFHEIFRRAPDVMAIVRASDSLMYEVNDAFERASGRRRAEVEGRRSRDFPWWPSPEVRDRVLGRLRDQGYLDDEEVCFTVGDREIVSVIDASPILFRGERCVIWRATDITEKREAERTTRALEERLRHKERLEHLGLLAGGIAHDFNNLLVGVMGNADLALSMVQEGSPLAAPLRAILASTQRMADHTRELLDYAGHTAVKLSPIQLESLLAEVVELARPLVHEGVSLRLERASSEAIWIRGDAGQLTRLFLNLVKNCVEALEPAPGSIVLSLDASEDQAEIRVSDSGHGMDEQTRAAIFEPFFSTKRKGHGLGLAFAPSIVERHEGTVSVESAVGRGTTVTVRLPRIAQDTSVDKARVASAVVRGEGRVLVVDDEPEVRRVAHAMLKQLGYDVVEAEGGMAALQLVMREPHGCSLVLLDATMPDLDGAQTFKRLREIDPTLPVLLCSGYSQLDFGPLLNEQPRASFLTKPYRIEQLANAIVTLLETPAAASADAASREL